VHVRIEEHEEMVMNLMVGLFGMIWTQLVVEIIMLPVSLERV